MLFARSLFVLSEPSRFVVLLSSPRRALRARSGSLRIPSRSSTSDPRRCFSRARFRALWALPICSSFLLLRVALCALACVLVESLRAVLRRTCDAARSLLCYLSTSDSYFFSPPHRALRTRGCSLRVPSSSSTLPRFCDAACDAFRALAFSCSLSPSDS